MDCLLALWPLLLLVSSVTCKFWSPDLYLKKLPCNMVCIYTHTEFNKASCSTRDLDPVSFSLSLSLSGWFPGARKPAELFPALAFETSQDFLRGRPVPMWAVQALSKGFIGFLCNPGNVSLFPSFTFLSLTQDHQVPVHWRTPALGKMQYLRNKNMIKSSFHFHFSLSCIGEGNGNPLQCSCLENPRQGSLVGCRLWGCTESDTTETT